MKAWIEGAVITTLILLNGWLSLSEMAVIASRKFRLRQWAEKGKDSAKQALFLAENSSLFLSSIQVGITLVGILLGVFSGSTVVKRLSYFLSAYAGIRPFAEFAAFLLVTLGVTILILLFGELIPKKIALSQPENLAMRVSGPITFFSKIIRPIVFLLSTITDAVLRLFRINSANSEELTESEIREMMLQGKHSGVFNSTEYQIMERVLRLGDRDVQSIMVPRRRMFWIDVNDQAENILASMMQSSFSYLPLCEDSLDQLIGIIRMKDVLNQWLFQKKLDLRSITQPVVFVYERMGALEVLDLFRKNTSKIALVVDEYGLIQGMVSFFDYLQAMIGDPFQKSWTEDTEIRKLSASSYEVDGMIRMDQVLELFELPLQTEYRLSSSTVSGFIMESLGRIPVTGDCVRWGSLRFYVKEMHQYKIHRLVVSLDIPKESENEA